jgi:hypothetical protein
LHWAASLDEFEFDRRKAVTLDMLQRIEREHAILKERCRRRVPARHHQLLTMMRAFMCVMLLAMLRGLDGMLCGPMDWRASFSKCRTVR